MCQWENSNHRLNIRNNNHSINIWTHKCQQVPVGRLQREGMDQVIMIFFHNWAALFSHLQAEIVEVRGQALQAGRAQAAGCLYSALCRQTRDYSHPWNLSINIWKPKSLGVPLYDVSQHLQSETHLFAVDLRVIWAFPHTVHFSWHRTSDIVSVHFKCALKSVKYLCNHLIKPDWCRTVV